MEWKALANKLLRNRRVVLHTDSAKSYKLKVDGVIPDMVVHCNKRVQVNGTFRWQKPHYKSGAQIVDRAWHFLKYRTNFARNCRAGSKALRTKLRSAQYGEYWHKNDDLWLHCGMLCSQNIKNRFGV